METALLPALSVSQRRRQVPLIDFCDPYLGTKSSRSCPDPTILGKAVDLLAWLQMPQDIIMLVVIYLIRLASIATFGGCPGIWAEFLVCLRFA